MQYKLIDNPRKARHDLHVTKPWPTAMPERLFDGPGNGGALEIRIGAGGKRKQPYTALSTIASSGALVLHKAVAKKLPAGLVARTIEVPFAVAAKKPPNKDYVIAVIDRYAPIDREASDVGTYDGLDVLVGPLMELRALKFAHPDALPLLFRLVDHPQLIVARDDIAELLEELTGGDVCEWERMDYINFPPANLTANPVKLSSAAAKAAYAAYWKLAKSRKDAKARAAALKHPALAVAVGLEIDQGSRPDTRAAALQNPFWAGMYAMHVDRKPSEDTRAAAYKTMEGACAYAQDVDLSAHGDLRARMLESDWWDAETADGFLQSVDALHAEMRGRGATRREVATRDLPKRKAAPRYLEKARGVLAPLAEDIREDVEAMSEVGYRWLEVESSTDASSLIDALYYAAAAIQSGERKLPAGAKKTQTLLGLCCVLADALNRGLGWQWAMVTPPGTAAVVSPEGTHGIVPMHVIKRVAAKGAKTNTLALMFNMLVDGNVPPKQRGQVVFIS